MRVLYVTTLWSGLRDVLFSGLPPRGMPAFVQPLRALAERGHTVRLLVATPPDVGVLNLGVPWIRPCDVTLVPWKSGGVGALRSLTRVVAALRRMLSSEPYDFVYGHGSLGGVASTVASWYGVPSGARIYGTFLARELDKRSLWSVALRHPLEFWSFRAPKSFTMVTNDGTQGDRVFRTLATKRSGQLHFWLNGVDHLPGTGDQIPKTGLGQEPYLFYPARIARWKQQSAAVELLHYLHQRGHTRIRLIFAGHISDPPYFEEVKGLAASLGVDTFVEHAGAIGREEMVHHFRQSVATLSFYSVSNLGNVVIEALSSGGLVVALDDGSLNEIVVDGETGMLVRDPEQGAAAIVRLLSDPSISARMRFMARESSARLFRSWQDRATEEINVIEHAVRGHHS
jgi:glycosyltransferase involved in cell wall biosynthesis